MEYYADIDQNNKVIGIKQVSDGYINNGQSIRLDSYDDKILGKIYNNGLFKGIKLTTDKNKIYSDGIDTATITATIDDLISTEVIELYYDETLIDSQTTINGVSTFQITMIKTGILNLTVKSANYGQASIQIEGV